MIIVKKAFEIMKDKYNLIDEYEYIIDLFYGEEE